MRSPSSSSDKVGLKRGPWTAEEDKLLSDYIKKEGEGKWRTLPTRAGLLRCGKSCRLRWMNYLRPSVKRGHITPDEEDLIIRLHRLLGNRWSLIAGRIPGRTDNEIKNYWNTHLSKKLMSQGIDPKTHKPLTAKPPNTYSINKTLQLDSSTETVLPSSNYYAVPFSKTDNNSDEGTSYCNAGFQEDSHCTDDAFSAFVNSLINDDMFESHQQEKKAASS